MIYFKMFFKLNPDWIGTHYQDKPLSIFSKFFFYSGKIQHSQDEGSKKSIGHMFDGENSRLFQLEFDWHKLNFSWMHRELNDFISFSIYKKENSPLWIGDYKITDVGKGKVKCLIFEDIFELFKKTSSQ